MVLQNIISLDYRFIIIPFEIRINKINTFLFLKFLKVKFKPTVDFN